LAGVHEIDPDQLESFASSGAALDTSPWPRRDERYDAWFIAGFHHTHAPLAIQALESGAYAVVEKPLATTNSQYEDIKKALGSVSQKRLFTGFHKRYSRINEWIRKDFGFFQSGDPVDMHCIVYEIPLPRLHWYNWPNSGSRLISNGCHWLDYYLYLNGFAAVVDAGVIALHGSDLSAWVRLDNGSQLVMSLTDSGSHRLGVREIIELRTGNKTARIIDGTYYQAESSDRMLRRRKVNPMESYARMYKTICKCILAKKDGDPSEALLSAKLMLDLEQELKRKRGVL
jgi:predicted dehydrogenase